MLSAIVFCKNHAIASSNSSPVIFSQDKINIISHREIEIKKKPKESNDNLDEEEIAKNEGKPNITTELQEVSYEFQVNIRKNIKENKGWLQHQSNLKKDKAILIPTTATDAINLQTSQIYKPTDILLIRKTGKIDAILPNVIPMEIGEAIITTEPIIAVLYLHPNICEELNILPNDQVMHDIFSPKVKIIR